MHYNLIITENADRLLDELLCYLLDKLKNVQAASHLIKEIESIYKRLSENPYQFPESKDFFMRGMGYREAITGKMNYLVVFRVDRDTVYVTGIFHQTEDYRRKICPG